MLLLVLLEEQDAVEARLSHLAAAGGTGRAATRPIENFRCSQLLARTGSSSSSQSRGRFLLLVVSLHAASLSSCVTCRTSSSLPIASYYTLSCASATQT